MQINFEPKFNFTSRVLRPAQPTLLHNSENKCVAFRWKTQNLVLWVIIFTTKVILRVCNHFLSKSVIGDSLNAILWLRWFQMCSGGHFRRTTHKLWHLSGMVVSFFFTSTCQKALHFFNPTAGCFSFDYSLLLYDWTGPTLVPVVQSLCIFFIYLDVSLNIL
jgi:hypothetical protein